MMMSDSNTILQRNSQVSGEILWLDHKLPIAKGDPVATLTLKSEDGNILKVVELQACYKVPMPASLTQNG